MGWGGLESQAFAIPFGKGIALEKIPLPDRSGWVSFLSLSRPRCPFLPPAMSQHPSLKSSKSVGAKRNVLKRFERIKALKAAGRYPAGRSPLGLPKTKPAE